MGDAPHHKRAIRFVWRLLRKMMHFARNWPFLNECRGIANWLPNKFNLTSAITTLPPPTYVLSSDANNRSSSSLACEAANFWLFLTVVLVFLMAFCRICAARTWRFSTTFRDSTTFRFRVVFRAPTTPVVWGLAAFWATGGDRQAAHLRVGSHSSSSSGIL